VVDFSKFFVDSINSVVKGFEQFFGAAIESVVGFFSSSFNRIVNAFAADFKNAMSDPIGFVTGKFDLALAAVNKNGALTFKTSFDEAGGSVLDKISAGLGSTSDMYGQRLKDGTAAITDEFGKVIDGIEPSAKDFFGAKPAAAEAVDKFKEVESVGTKLRNDFLEANASADGLKKNTGSAADEAGNVATSFSKAEGSSKSIKDELTQSAKLLDSIDKARSKEAADPGGTLQKKADSQIEKKDFSGAERTAKKIARNETEADIRGTGKNKDRRNIADIGKDFGLRQQLGEKSSDFANRIKDVRDGKAEADKFGNSKKFDSKDSANVDKPNQDGKKSPDNPSDKNPAKNTLESLVGEIKNLLKKIEPRLPVAALTA